MKQVLLMIAVVALVGCGGGSKETGGGTIARNFTNCIDCEGIVAPSAVSCLHCGSTDFTGSKRKEEKEAEHKEKEEAEVTALDGFEEWMGAFEKPVVITLQEAQLQNGVLSVEPLPGKFTGAQFDGVDADRLTLKLRPKGEKNLKGRFVRVTNVGANVFLHLAEVQVFSAGQNVAPKGKARQSTTAFGGPAKYGNDGNTNGEFTKKSTTHTAQENNPWWEVDLGKELPIEKLAIWNRLDAGLADRLKMHRVEVFDANRKVVWKKESRKVFKVNVDYGLDGARLLPFVPLPHSKLNGLLRLAEPVELKEGDVLEVAIKNYKNEKVKVSLTTSTLAELEDALPKDVFSILRVPAATRTAAHVNRLKDYFAAKRKEEEWARIVANTPPPPKVPKLDIRLTQKGFKTDPENFQVVCKSAAMTIARYYHKRQFKPILITKADNGYPVKLNEPGPKGESQIMLSISNGWMWSQIAFQFAHEFTHILINEKMPGSAPNHWINEAFCEAASYHAIKQMAKEWAAHPPYPNWKDYAKSLNTYADLYLGKGKAKPEGMEFIAWFKKNEKALRLGKWFPKYGLYKYPAYQFYQIIKEDPSQLGAIAFLNFGLRNRNPALSTHQYLARWKMVLPVKHKPFADQIAAVFGYSLPK